MIKFFLKIIIVLIVAFAAVIYHNTESGKEMERRIGKEINFENLEERGGELLRKTIYFLSLKGLEYKEKTEKKAGEGSENKEVLVGHEGMAGDAESVDKGEAKADRDIKSYPQSKSGSAKPEHIGDADRKRLEQIIESGG